MRILVEQDQYKAERDKILQDMIKYHKAEKNDYRFFVKKFVKDLSDALMTIQSDPCRYPDFPYPVKKKLISKGTTQCAVLFMPYPVDHNNDSKRVEKVYLSSIMRTASGQYNDYIIDEYESCDLDL